MRHNRYFYSATMFPFFCVVFVLKDTWSSCGNYVSSNGGLIPSSYWTLQVALSSSIELTEEEVVLKCGFLPVLP